MNIKNTEKSIAAVILLLWFATIADAVFSLGKKIWWFDIPMHITGGILAALFFYYFFVFRWKNYATNGQNIYTLFAILGFVSLIGIFWEFYEYLLDLLAGTKFNFPKSQPDIDDTMKDFANDLIGGTLVWLIILKAKIKIKTGMN